MTTLALFELACGAQSEEQLHDLELLTRAAHIIALDSPAALQAGAGAIYRDLRARGQLVDVTDLLIAGCCLANRLPLFTRNTEHFSLVRGLELVGAEEILGGGR